MRLGFFDFLLTIVWLVVADVLHALVYVGLLLELWCRVDWQDCYLPPMRLVFVVYELALHQVIRWHSSYGVRAALTWCVV